MNDFVPDRNILPCFRSRFRCPLTTAPVRTEGLFQRPTVVILHREQTRPQDPSWRTSETFGSNSSARIFVVARQRRGVPLSDKGTRSARPGGVLPSRTPFNLKLWIPTKKEDSNLKHRVISILSASMKSRISASRSCFAKPDWSITETGLAILDNPKIAPKTTLDRVCFYSFRYMCFAR